MLGFAVAKTGAATSPSPLSGGDRGGVLPVRDSASFDPAPSPPQAAHLNQIYSRRESQFHVISDTPDKNYAAILVLPLRTENWSHKSACWASRFPSGAEARVLSGFLRRG